MTRTHRVEFFSFPVPIFISSTRVFFLKYSSYFSFLSYIIYPNIIFSLFKFNVNKYETEIKWNLSKKWKWMSVRFHIIFTGICKILQWYKCSLQISRLPKPEHPLWTLPITHRHFPNQFRSELCTRYLHFSQKSAELFDFMQCEI